MPSESESGIDERSRSTRLVKVRLTRRRQPVSISRGPRPPLGGVSLAVPPRIAL